MSNKWLPAASSTRPFWALTSATAASAWPPGPPCLQTMDAPVSTSISTADWMPLNQPLPRVQRLRKLFAFLGALCSDGPSAVKYKAVLTIQPILHMSNRDGIQIPQKRKNKVLNETPLKPSFRQERSKSPYSLSKPEHMVKLFQCNWATVDGFQSSHTVSFPHHPFSRGAETCFKNCT